MRQQTNHLVIIYSSYLQKDSRQMSSQQQTKINVFLRKIFINKKKRQVPDRPLISVSKLQVLSDPNICKRHINKPSNNKQKTLGASANKPSGASSTNKLSNHMHIFANFCQARGKKTYKYIRKNSNQSNLSISNLNDLIFRNEFQQMVKSTKDRKLDQDSKRKMYETFYQSQYQRLHQNRVHNFSQYCKQSLRQFNHKQQFHRWQHFIPSYSNSNIKHSNKFENAQIEYRSHLKRKYRTLEHKKPKKQQLKGWEDIQVRYSTICDHNISDSLYFQ